MWTKTAVQLRFRIGLYLTVSPKLNCPRFASQVSAQQKPLDFSNRGHDFDIFRGMAVQ